MIRDLHIRLERCHVRYSAAGTESTVISSDVLTTASQRELLYTTFISSDGNFYLQLWQHKTTLASDPSLWGDNGFWANQSIFETYISNAKATGKEKV